VIGRSDKAGQDYLLSLNDTLTCGFGASLILFFVFAVLVVFEDSGRSSDGASGFLANAAGRALRAEELAGSPQLYLRIHSNDGRFIEDIIVPDSDDWHWAGASLTGELGEPGLLVLHWDGAFPPPPLEFTVEDGRTGSVTVTAMVGGTLITPEIGTRYIHQRGTDLFTINLLSAEPFVFASAP
jgi:hypothetical protein